MFNLNVRGLPAGWCFFLVIILTGNLIGIKNVVAETRTVLSIQPVSTEMSVGEVNTISLFVENGVNLAGYDLTITYDSNMLDLSTWGQGGFLTNPAVIKQVNTPGTLRVVAAQLGAPGVSGNGNLLNISFMAKATGNSQIIISDAQLVSASNEYLTADLSGATITVYEKINTSTSTVTPSATSTPTNTKTNPSAPTKTNTPPVIVTMVPAANATPEFAASQFATGVGTLNTGNQVTETLTSQLSPLIITSTSPILRDSEATTLLPNSNDSGSQKNTPVDLIPGVNEGKIEPAAKINSLLWVILFTLASSLGFIVYLLIKQGRKQKS